MFSMLKNMKIFYKLMLLFLIDLAWHSQSTPGKFTISLWHLKKEVRNEVRDLTAWVDSNTTLTIYYTSNVLPLLTLFLSQYEIHTKLSLYLIRCSCNISLLLLFQVTVDPCKLTYFSGPLRTNFKKTFTVNPREVTPYKNLLGYFCQTSCVDIFKKIASLIVVYSQERLGVKGKFPFPCFCLVFVFLQPSFEYVIYLQVCSW